MRRNVWVTGVGIVSAAGNGCEALASLLRGARSGVSAVPELDDMAAGRIPGVWGGETRRLDRSATLFVEAATEAWRNAGLEEDARVGHRCALLEGSSLGALAATLDEHAERTAESPRPRPRPSALLKLTSGTGGAEYARRRGIQGPVMHLSSGSVSSACAIGEAYEMIVGGRVDIAVAGGAECPLHPEIVAHFDAAGILAMRDGDHAGCRPFDRWRSGTALGEGAAVLLLESEQHARARGARPRALVRGFGVACEASSPVSPDPDGRGVTAAIWQAMEHVSIDEVRWIKTHGTGTVANDAAECRGITAALGERFSDLPITSLKPALGHTLGASGAVEMVAVILALADGVVPATLCTEEVDPSLPHCRVARHIERSQPGVVLTLAEGFGGRCTALALEAA